MEKGFLSKDGLALYDIATRIDLHLKIPYGPLELGQAWLSSIYEALLEDRLFLA